MKIFQLLFLCFSITVDGFAIAISYNKPKNKNNKQISIALSFWLIFFQLLFLLFGFALSKIFLTFINSFCNYISFTILLCLGVKMICDAVTNKKENSTKAIFILSFLSSFDALSIGIASSNLKINIVLICIISCIFTIFFTFFGVFLNKKFELKLKKFITFFSGLFFIFSGVKILI